MHLLAWIILAGVILGVLIIGTSTMKFLPESEVSTAPVLGDKGNVFNENRTEILKQRTEIR